MSKDVNTKQIAKYLREMAQEAKEREVAKRIVKAGEELLGDSNFAFQREAALLATVDLVALENFLDRVVELRQEMDAKFKQALGLLGDDNENA